MSMHETAEPNRRRRSLRLLARKIVRVFSVTALIAGGFVGAAESLSEIDDLDDDQAIGRARILVAHATSEVLEHPPLDGDRALLALVAAQEALAMAGNPNPTDQDLHEMLVAAWVAEEAAAG